MAARIDISSELSVIAIEPYGDAVKTAVHDAIHKVNGSGGIPRNDRPRKIDRLFDIIKAEGSAEAEILTGAIPQNVVVSSYSPSDFDVDLGIRTWIQQSFVYQSTACITCPDTVEIPVGATSVSVKIKLRSGAPADSCFIFFHSPAEEADPAHHGDDYDHGWYPSAVSGAIDTAYDPVTKITTHTVNGLTGRYSFWFTISNYPIDTSVSQGIVMVPSDLESCRVYFS